MRASTFVAGLLLTSALAQAAPALELDTTPVVLGRTESVGVTLHLDEASQVEHRPLRLAVNVGTFGAIERVKRGVYRTVYVPPPTRYPQVALVAIWRETGPDAPIAFLRFPLLGVTKLPVTAQKGAEVWTELGGIRSPSVVADKKKLELPLEVPPGVTTALLSVQEPRKPLFTKELPVQVPPYNRLTAALVPHAIAADGEQWARIEVFYDLGGVDVTADRVKVDASVGQARFVSAAGGKYTFRYVPPKGGGAEQVQFKVSIDGDETAKASAALSLKLPPPAQLVIQPPEAALAADGKSTTPVRVYVFDANGLGVPAPELEVKANGASVGIPRHLGSGVHEVTFTSPSAYPPGGLVRFEAKSGVLSASVNHQLAPPPTPSAVYARFEPGLVPADGRTTARLVLDVRDTSGLPLQRSQLIAIASHGAASPISSGADGKYEATYVPPGEIPEGEVVLKLVDPTGTFERSVPVPLREDPGALLIGVRGSFGHDLSRFGTPRAGLDLWIPLHLGSSTFGVGLVGSVAQAQQTVSDGTLSSRSEALFVPASLRFGYEVAATRRLSVHVGAAPSGAWARFRNDLAAVQRQAFGFGAQGFGSVSLAAGPGQLVFDLAYSYLPVRAPDFELDAGGAEAGLSYRVGLF